MIEEMYIVEIEDGSILGRFPSLDEAKKAAEGVDALTRVQKIHHTSVIDCCRVKGYDSLYCVNISWQTLYIEAPDCAAAVVSAVALLGNEGLSLEVAEYELPRPVYGARVTPKDSHLISELSLRLLMAQNEYNRDFVALALSYAMDADSLEEILEWETARSRRNEYSSPLLLSPRELRERIRVWHFPSFVDETDATQQIFSLYKSHEKLEDAKMLLALSYLFEQWAGYDSTYPYTLCSLLLYGGLDKEIESLSEARQLLL